MNTLREIGKFVGMTNRINMRSVGNRVPLLSSSERTSMRAMIIGLQNLPPISLEVEPVGNQFGKVPFAPVFHVHPSNGVILETRMSLLPNGSQLEETALVGNSGNFSPFTLRFVGVFVLLVRRTGIQNTGITTLEKHFHVEGVEPPPPPPPPIVPPFISVKSNGDSSFVVNGSGFLKSRKVTIRVADTQLNNLFFAQTSTPDGKLVEMPTGKICQVPGGQITFSGQDGSLDPSNHQAIFSNFVTMTCPFPK